MIDSLYPHAGSMSRWNQCALAGQHAPRQVQLKKRGTKIPRVELAEIGPSADLTLDRTKPADAALLKAAKKAPPTGTAAPFW